MADTALYSHYADPIRIGRYTNKFTVFTETERPYTRLIFSDEFYSARRWLTEEFKSLGLHCHIDSGCSLIGRRPAGPHFTASQTVIIGSHIDTVPSGGRFDGVAGVITTMEIIHYLNERSIELPFTLEVADFLGEEFNVWSTSCLGSRHMAGLLDGEMLVRSDDRGRILGHEVAAGGGHGRSPIWCTLRRI